ncbi:hypothetical protein LguiA_026113 [Lonicera macranthoides]
MAGTNGDKCNPAAFCRADIGLDFCQLCTKNATLYFSICMARYSDKEVYGTLDIRNAIVAFEVEIKIMDPNSYYQDVRVLFDNLNHGIAKDRSGGEFATGKRAGNVFCTIYGLVQCSPDLNKQQCLEKAATSITVIRKDWDWQSAVVSFYPQFIFQYGTRKFYNESIVDLSPGLPLGNQGIYVHICIC